MSACYCITSQPSPACRVRPACLVICIIAHPMHNTLLQQKLTTHTDTIFLMSHIEPNSVIHTHHSKALLSISIRENTHIQLHSVHIHTFHALLTPFIALFQSSSSKYDSPLLNALGPLYVDTLMALVTGAGNDTPPSFTACDTCMVGKAECVVEMDVGV